MGLREEAVCDAQGKGHLVKLNHGGLTGQSWSHRGDQLQPRAEEGGEAPASPVLQSTPLVEHGWKLRWKSGESSLQE